MWVSAVSYFSCQQALISSFHFMHVAQKLQIITMSEKQSAGDEGGDLGKECEELLPCLPKERGWIFPYMYLYQGHWCVSEEAVQAIINFQQHFQAKDSDILVASNPKSGTTWLKALTFSVVNRHRFEIKTHPLLTSNSHHLVPFLEFNLYMDNPVPDLSSEFPPDEPRLFATHMHFASLGTIKGSNCKIVYVCRNPFDTFVSLWQFVTKARSQSLSFDEAFDMYCQGKAPCGPFWDNMLGYWNESLKRPQNVLFLMYEEMKEDIVLHLNRLAKFLDCPFTEEEERNGLIQDIADLCSFKTMKNLETNKTGTFAMNVEKKHLFRKAEVGDWVNHFTSEMEERTSNVIQEKLGGSGLTIKGFPRSSPAKLVKEAF